VTDIELMPDGRIFVFGTSLEVLDVLNELRTTTDDDIHARLHRCDPTNDASDFSNNGSQS
jgi:hypothetical protein